ncbi:MAG TPA: DUF3991 and toprim domain-containing protein [Bacillota bacterium]|nr:DUF3991 and toprim domain-containing protein [Bacillota bacterium]
MPHYTDEQIQAANGCDLAAFLISRDEALKRCGNQQIWEKHQVWIRGHEWYTHYDAKGGYAVSFVMQYFGLSFQDSIRELLGDSVSTSRPASYTPKPQKELVLPQPSQTMNRVYAYLMNERFIARDVITHFAHAKTLYEDAEYHNCIFVGIDEDGIPRHCHRRGTSTVGKPFKQTETGSKTEYAFHHDGGSEWLFVFEAPIDMLAFITLHQKEWQKHSYVALCCVSERAILHRLKVNTKLAKIVLCLDNDNAGEAASERIKAVLAEHGYADVRILKSVNKDWDEDIKSQNGVSPIRAEASACDEVKELCHAFIKEAEYAKQPPTLREKTLSAYTAVINASQYSLKERIGNFLGLLLLLAKDECRKCLSPIEWPELETQLLSEYVSYSDNGDVQSRLRQLDADMKALNAVYAKEQMTCDRTTFLKPLMRVCMDCVRLTRYLERKEKNS